jgi:phytoene desaturase
MTNQPMYYKINSKEKKVIVVGGGLGGLATGALLAKDGFAVTLYEKTQMLGGRATCKKIAEYWLDSGFHSIRRADKGPAAAILKTLGKQIELATRYSDGVIPKTYHNGRLADSPLSAGQLLFRYPLLSFMQKMRMMMLIQKVKKIPIEKLDKMTVAELLAAAKINDNNIIAHIKQMIAIAYYCEPDLEKISAGELARYLADWPYDVGFPKSGWKQIIDKLQEAIVENGGVIRTGNEITGVQITEAPTDGPKATGVVLRDQTKVEADIVVLNTPLKEIPNLLEEKYLSDKLTKLLYNGIQTSASAVIEVGINTEIIKGRPDTIITLEPCIIFRENSKYDATIVPKGCHLLSAWMPIDSAKSKDKAYVDAKFKELEETMHEVFPNLGNSSPTIIRKMIFGTAIGFYPSPSMTHSKRPSVIFPNVKNLYLVGDATNAAGIGGSSDIAFNSAIECRNSIIRGAYR